MTLLEATRAALVRARATFDGTSAAPKVDALLARLDEPLRVAIAGRVKAGKSTLLNALVGQELAQTDAGECTKIVTWYRDGLTYRATLHPVEGEATDVPISRNGGALRVDLGDYRAEHVERLVIDWPSESLRTMTLIDTPGIASASIEVGERAHTFLTAGDDEPTASDAVLYLMHHLHSSDVRFLEAFRDQDVSQPAPINTIAVLARADEIGAGKLDGMVTAERIADRYRHNPEVRILCQTVVPVSALLAQAGETLQEREFKALGRIAAAPREQSLSLLLSADRFLRLTTSVEIDTAMREHLMRRFGLFGIRLAVSLIQAGDVPTSTKLAAELVRRSGLDELRSTLAAQFASRRDVLKARAALSGLDHIVRETAAPGATEIAAELERTLAGAHEFEEIRLLSSLLAGEIGLRDGEIEEGINLLGGNGPSLRARLRLPEEATAAEAARVLEEAVGRWQSRAESPLSSPDVVTAARILVRTCERLIVGANEAP